MENPLYIRPCNILYALYYKIPRGLLRDFYVCPLSSESKSENYELITASNP